MCDLWLGIFATRVGVRVCPPRTLDPCGVCVCAHVCVCVTLDPCQVFASLHSTSSTSSPNQDSSPPGILMTFFWIVSKSENGRDINPHPNGNGWFPLTYLGSGFDSGETMGRRILSCVTRDQEGAAGAATGITMPCALAADLV